MRLQLLGRSSPIVGLPHEQVGLDHVPDCPLGPVAIVDFGPLPIVTVRPLDMVGGPGAVDVVQEGDGLGKLLGSERSDHSLERVAERVQLILDDLPTFAPGLQVGLVSREEAEHLQDKVSDQAEAGVAGAQFSNGRPLGLTQLLLSAQKDVTEAPQLAGILFSAHLSSKDAPKVVDGGQDVLGNGVCPVRACWTGRG